MTYEEIVYMCRDFFENADARMIFEHIAIQVNVEGEGSGIFYMEVADRSICIEPYDYYDRDGLVITDAATLCDIISGKMSLSETIESGRLRYEGNQDKFALFRSKVVLPKYIKLKEQREATKKPSVKKAATKKAPAKKASAKKASDKQ